MSNSPLLLSAHWLDVGLRLLMAIGVGALVGWERQSRHKPAGLRTHMLVSLGAALFVMVGLGGGLIQPQSDGYTRVIQGVTTGVGFLGAGEIFSKSRSEADRVKIRGLTSAAAIWVSAALGSAAGCGLWQIALMGALLTFLVLWGVKKIEPDN